jgi:hypothetical protein
MGERSSGGTGASRDAALALDARAPNEEAAEDEAAEEEPLPVAPFDGIPFDAKDGSFTVSADAESTFCAAKTRFRRRAAASHCSGDSLPHSLRNTR